MMYLMDSRHERNKRLQDIWRQANLQLLPSVTLSIAGATIGSIYGNVRTGTFDHKLVALFGVVTFVIFAAASLGIIVGTIHRLLAHYEFTSGRIGVIQFAVRVIGYGLIFLLTLALLGIPIGNLLLGGAAVGIILGVAAQQALANFFASIILITAHPFSVGDTITFNSGALGGKYTGEVIDIGLTHTRLKEKDGTVVLLPNATLLLGSTITLRKATTK